MTDGFIQSVSVIMTSQKPLLAREHPTIMLKFERANSCQRRHTSICFKQCKYEI